MGFGLLETLDISWKCFNISIGLSVYKLCYVGNYHFKLLHETSKTTIDQTRGYVFEVRVGIFLVRL